MLRVGHWLNALNSGFVTGWRAKVDREAKDVGRPSSLAVKR